MENLAGYDSDASENSQNPTPKKDVVEIGKFTPTISASKLEAEWDSFEKMICDSPTDKDSGKVSVPDVIPLPVLAPVPPVGVVAPVPVVPPSESKPAAVSSDSSSSESDDSDDSDSESESEKKKEEKKSSKSKPKKKASSDSSDSSSSEEESSDASSSSEEEEEEEKSDESTSSSDDDDKKAKNGKTAEVKTKSPSPIPEKKPAVISGVTVDAKHENPKTSVEKRASQEKASSKTSGRRSSEGRRSSHRSRSRSRSRSRDRRRRRSSSRSRRRRGRSKSPRRHRSSRSKRSRSRSRSRDRHRDRRVSTSSATKSPDREKSSRSRRRSSRSRSRDRRSSRSDHKRHSSRDRHRRRRSRDRRRRSRSRDRRRRSRSRDRYRRSRSRSHSPDRSHTNRYTKRGKKGDDTEKKPRSFKEHLKQQLLNVQKQAADGKLTLDFELQKKRMADSKVASAVKSGNPFVALSTTGEKVTPQEALLQTMAAMHQKAQELTGVAVPKYYNPAAVNPLKYAEQFQKRKLLWSKAKDKKEETEAAWGGTAFNQDQDGKVAAKFRKLMGINMGGKETGEGLEKGPEAGGSSAAEVPTNPKAEEIMQKQHELFEHLDKEYEYARMTTHTHRGVGLGFASHVPTFPK